LNENDGVLILSRGAGAAEELGEDAVMIEDPTSVAETADAIERALDMPAEERKAHCASLRERVESRGPDDWIEAQTADLIAIRNGDDPAPPSLTL
jgi:trehalose 6-phosphate synthase